MTKQTDHPFPVVHGEITPYCESQRSQFTPAKPSSTLSPFVLCYDQYYEQLSRLLSLLSYLYPYNLRLTKLFEYFGGLYCFHKLQGNDKTDTTLTLIAQRTEDDKNKVIQAIQGSGVISDAEFKQGLNLFFPEYHKINALDLINELFFSFSQAKIGRLFYETHKEMEKMPQNYTQDDVKKLGIEPIPGKQFQKGDNITTLYQLTQGVCQCQMTGIPIRIHRNNAIEALGWVDYTSAETFSELIVDQCFRLGWYRMTLHASAKQTSDINACIGNASNSGVWAESADFSPFAPPKLVFQYQHD